MSVNFQNRKYCDGTITVSCYRFGAIGLFGAIVYSEKKVNVKKNSIIIKQYPESQKDLFVFKDIQMILKTFTTSHYYNQPGEEEKGRRDGRREGWREGGTEGGTEGGREGRRKEGESLNHCRILTSDGN